MPGTSCLPLLPSGFSHCNGLYCQPLSLNKLFSLQVTFVRCFVIATTVTNKVAMLGLNCFCEVFIHWTCSKEHWALVCHRINQRATLPTSFHPQMLPIAEKHTGLAWCSCQTEGSLGRHVGTYCAQQAAPLNLLFYWQMGLLRTGLHHSPQASCHPNRWAQV